MNQSAEGEIEDGAPPAAFVSAQTGGLRPNAAGLYRLLVESVQDYAIFALDRGGHIISWNRGAQRLKGYTPTEIIGRHFSIFYPTEDIARGKPPWELQIADREGRFEEEGWRLRKDGTRFWANVVITALRDDHGELVGFAKVTRDLTERRAALEALRESEERFRHLVQSVSDYGIFMLDPEGHVVSWNDGAARITGYQPAEIIGRHFSVFYPADDVAANKPGWELEVAEREGRFEEEGWRMRRDGSRFWSSVIITSIRDSHGKLAGYAKVTRDLTERRAADERALADARRIAAAEEANRAKSEFLAAMSHELRTPLNAIGGFTDLLALGLRGPITPEQVEDLERIRRAQRHLLGIINDLLNFTRVESGRLTYELAPVRIVDVVDAVATMIAPQATAKGVRFELGGCDPTCVALADRAKVDQILLNLLSNAVKFTAEGGRIDVGCGIEGDHVALHVTDTGIGIAADKLEEIFEPFVQLGRSLTSMHEGTGLGLAISRDLARAMGGELS
ncbi:MAG TPA: PAS domain-containing sensor histidine kinase, partial [Gemmatimonadaceae bacterium]|nr:PAS domain-containing sensor histidine kinase [Gemmatimonadaceae bacterium]